MTSDVTIKTEPEEPSEKSVPYYIPAEKREKTTDLEAIRAAFEACKNQEIGIQEAALLYGVHKRQLRFSLRHYDVDVIDKHYRVFVLTDFPAQAEIELAGYLQDLISSHVYMTNIDVRRLGYELLRMNYGVDYLPKNRNCILGQRWYRNLMTKFPQLDVGHPHFKDIMEDLTSFYDSLENLVTIFGIDSTTIFCVDGVDLNTQAWNMQDDRFTLKKLIFTDYKAIVCTSPVGMFIPPLYLVPREDDAYKYDIYDVDPMESEDDSDEIEIIDDKTGDPDFRSPGRRQIKVSSKGMSTGITKRDSRSDIAKDGKQVTAHAGNKPGESVQELRESLQEEGIEKFADCDAGKELKKKDIPKCVEMVNILTPELFHWWFEKFLTYVRETIDRRVLLLVCDQSFVKHFGTLELARENGVTFLALPPRSVHKIYPMDDIARSLTRSYAGEATRWLIENPRAMTREVPLYDFFKYAFDDIANPSTARDAFLRSGLWPINRNIFLQTPKSLQEDVQPVVGDTSSRPTSGTER